MLFSSLSESHILLSMLHTNKAFVLKTKRKKINVVVIILISVEKSDKSDIFESVKNRFTFPPTSCLLFHGNSFESTLVMRVVLHP